MLDAVIKLNRKHSEAYGDPEIETRIAQYEMAFRMQTSVPEFMDLSKETGTNLRAIRSRFQKAGNLRRPLPAGQAPGRARRALRPALQARVGPAQRSPARSGLQCKSVDQPSAALVQDLKQRGLLDETLVVWGGEFGRTVYCQGKLTETNYGRDHHPRLLHDVDGRRRDQGRSSAWAKPTISATTSCLTPCTFMTCRRPSSTASASITRA